MLRYLKPVIVVLGVVAPWAVPSGARAQTAFLEGRGGISAPTGEMARWVNAGPSFGAGLGLRLSRRLTLRADFDASFMEGERLERGGEAPGINLIHYVAGIETPLGGARSPISPLETSMSVFAGATTLEIEAFAIPHDRPQGGQVFILSENYFTAGAGFRAGYPLSRFLGVFVAARGYGVFADKEDTKILELLSDRAERFGTTWALPVAAGVRLQF